ncbi:MAG: precorrin-2 dehydrogenase [Acidimicrobiaceae bacterium]|nr:precorrin-2 dehydrogenase [Acidimicrobiaceae bacterium]
MPVDGPQYPVNLVVAGRRCLVVGGGDVAARKVEGLLACGALVHVVAIRVSPRIKSQSGIGAVDGVGRVDGVGGVGAAGAVGAAGGVRSVDSVTWEERAYRPGEVAGYRLVVAATDSPSANRAVFDDGEASGVWVNSADDPASCSFTLPSVVRRGPIMVTVSTGGHSPALATWLKRHVEDEMGPEYVVLLELLATERDAVKAAGRSTESLDWKKALDSDMLDLIRAGQINRARERLQACLSSSSA